MASGLFTMTIPIKIIVVFSAIVPVTFCRFSPGV
jgi:hypothetical protein